MEGFYDFMNEPVAMNEPVGSYGSGQVSYQPLQTLPSNMEYNEGGGTIPASTVGSTGGVTWGQLLQAVMRMSGSYPQYGGQGLGASPGGSAPIDGYIYPIGPTSSYGQPQTAGKGNQTDVQEVMQIASLFGGGGMAGGAGGGGGV